MNVFYQQAIERTYNKRLILKRIEKVVKEELIEQVQLAKEAISEYISENLPELNVDKTVISFLSQIMAKGDGLPLSSLSSMCSKYIGLEDTAENIYHSANLICLMTASKIYTLSCKSERHPIICNLKIGLTGPIKILNDNAVYLPPMVCKPAELKSNTESPYQTVFKDSLILGHRLNHHESNISLDVLNTLNNQAYSMDYEFMLTLDEPQNLPKSQEDNILPEQQWEIYSNQCKKMYTLLHQTGNVFYFSHKVDKRGRIYSQGYHLQGQGHSYKKAMLDLAHKEKVLGDLFL